MYPGTIFNWHDNSGIEVSSTSESRASAPLFMQVFSADKGTEDFIEISGPDFDAMYGTMSFSRHGQSAIQAKNIIDAGGRLYAKRVVAEDSTLANVVLIAKVTPEEDGVKVTWETKAIEGCKTFAEVKAEAEKLAAENEFPLIVYTDNGRGVSKKAVRLTPDYATSKTIGNTFYTLKVYEGTMITEQTTITVDPEVIYGNVAYRLDEYTNVQISGIVLPDVFEEYVKTLADELAIDIDVMRTYDVIFGYDCKGGKLDNFVIDADGVDLDSENGIVLAGGSNGAFGNAPVNTEAWTAAIVEAFANENEDHDEVYDLDQHKIAAVVDANYPDEVKTAIYNFVEFRKDCIFVRDYGTGLTTFAAINSRNIEFTTKGERNYFTADYATSYMISDPATKKAIEVTCTYDLASVLVNHIENNPYAPLAGISNRIVLKNAIKGTINFVPVNTPKGPQKEAMDNIRVNYAIFEDNDCVVQAQYTSQEAYTQLSYINSVLSIQRVLRAVRNACPKQRFSLSTSTDLSTYAAAVISVLSNFESNFSTLNFVYTQDDLKASQKIFYASIEFAFLGWAQTEIFDIYAINNQ